jgi:hypothetical protein
VVAGEDGGFGGGAPTLHKSSVYKLAREEARSLEKAEEGERRRRRRRKGSGGGGEGGGDGGGGGGGDAGEDDDRPSSLLDLPGAPFRRELRGGGSSSGRGAGPSGSGVGEEGAAATGATANEAAAAAAAAAGAAANPSKDWTPMIILVPLVLGLDKNINPRYLPSLLAMLSLPQTLGIVVGLYELNPVNLSLKVSGFKPIM